MQAVFVFTKPLPGVSLSLTNAWAKLPKVQFLHAG